MKRQFIQDNKSEKQLKKYPKKVKPSKTRVVASVNAYCAEDGRLFKRGLRYLFTLEPDHQLTNATIHWDSVAGRGYHRVDFTCRSESQGIRPQKTIATISLHCECQICFASAIYTPFDWLCCCHTLYYREAVGRTVDKNNVPRLKELAVLWKETVAPYIPVTFTELGIFLYSKYPQFKQDFDCGCLNIKQSVFIDRSEYEVQFNRNCVFKHKFDFYKTLPRGGKVFAFTVEQ